MNCHIKVQHCSEHHSNQCLPVCLLHLLRSPSPSPGPQEFFDHDQVGGIATRLHGLDEDMSPNYIHKKYLFKARVKHIETLDRDVPDVVFKPAQGHSNSKPSDFTSSSHMSPVPHVITKHLPLSACRKWQISELGKPPPEKRLNISSRILSHFNMGQFHLFMEIPGNWSINTYLLIIYNLRKFFHCQVSTGGQAVEAVQKWYCNFGGKMLKAW